MALLYVAFEKGHRLRVWSDEDSESPREWDNLGTMVCWHNRYSLGDKHEYEGTTHFFESLAIETDFLPAERDSIDPDALVDLIFRSGKYVILPLYLYDHGGLTINTTGFSCPWDSGQVGWIYCSMERLLEETKYSDREDAERILLSEVETYNQYLQGDVYGYTLDKQIQCPTCGHSEWEPVDSCWGFYGPFEEWLPTELAEPYCELVELLQPVSRR
mgnify:CR=1 FL=1